MRTIIRIQAEPFDAAAELAALSRDGVGAVASFTGHVRQEDGLNALLLEHYPGMTEREIARHVEDARTRWQLLGVTVIHRVGRTEARRTHRAGGDRVRPSRRCVPRPANS